MKGHCYTIKLLCVVSDFWCSLVLKGGTLARQARAGHLFGPVPLQWPFRGCTKGPHFAQCSCGHLLVSVAWHSHDGDQH